MLCDCDCDCDCDCNSPCSLCSRCQSCNQCNTKQTLCQTSQLASSYLSTNYNFGPFQRDQIIIKTMPLNTFNAMGKAAKTIATTIGNKGISGTNNHGAVSNANASWTDQPTTQPFIRADKTTELVKLINSISNDNNFVKSKFISNSNSNSEQWPANNTFIKDQHIVYGSYFNAIAKAINECKINSNACNACNSSGDAICPTCNTCNNCQAACQTDDNSGGSGHGSGCDCDCDSSG